MPNGEYFFLTHPAFGGEEMLLCGNEEISGEEVAKGRDAEAKMVGNRMLKYLMGVYGIRSIRYDEAVSDKRMTVEDITNMLGISEPEEEGKKK